MYYHPTVRIELNNHFEFMPTNYYRSIQTSSLVSMLDANIRDKRGTNKFNIDFITTTSLHHGLHQSSHPILFDGIITIKFKWKPSTAPFNTSNADIRPYIAFLNTAYRIRETFYGSVVHGNVSPQSRGLGIRLSTLAGGTFPANRTGFGMTNGSSSLGPVSSGTAPSPTISWVAAPTEYNECEWSIDTDLMVHRFTITNPSGAITTSEQSFTESSCNINKGLFGVFEIGIGNYFGFTPNPAYIESFKDIRVFINGIHDKHLSMFPYNQLRMVGGTTSTNRAIRSNTITDLINRQDVPCATDIVTSFGKFAYSPTLISNTLPTPLEDDWTFNFWCRVMNYTGTFDIVTSRDYVSSANGFRVRIVNTQLTLILKVSGVESTILTRTITNTNWNYISIYKNDLSIGVVFNNSPSVLVTQPESFSLTLTGYVVENSTIGSLIIDRIKVYNKALRLADHTRELSSFKFVGNTFSIAKPQPPREWTPADLGSKLFLWIDPTDESTLTLQSTDRVTRVADKSGNGRDAIQPTANIAPQRRFNIINGFPAFTFQGFHWTIPNAILVGYNYDLFTVLNMWSSSSQWAPFVTSHKLGTYDGNTDPDVITFLQRNSTSAALRTYQATHTVSLNIAYNTYYMVNSTISDQTTSLRFNGGLPTMLSAASSVSSPTPLNTTGGLFIGKFPTANNVIHSNSGDIILTHNITQEDRLFMEGYLSWKWDRVNTLPTNHPFRNERPMVQN